MFALLFLGLLPLNAGRVRAIHSCWWTMRGRLLMTIPTGGTCEREVIARDESADDASAENGRAAFSNRSIVRPRQSKRPIE